MGRAFWHDIGCLVAACLAFCDVFLPLPVPLLSALQAYNARRQGDLDALQAEADSVVQHLREQQRALAGLAAGLAPLQRQMKPQKRLQPQAAVLPQQQLVRLAGPSRWFRCCSSAWAGMPAAGASGAPMSHPLLPP